MRSFLAFVMFLVSVQLSAQYKYKELVPILDASSNHEQLAMLRQYIAEDAKEPNADFRLAMVHYNLFRKADPLIEFDIAMAHAREAELRFIRSKQLVTESEVRKKNEYYAPLFNTVDSKGRPFVEFFALMNKMQIASDSVTNFKNQMPRIYRAFTKSVDHYGQAVKMFETLNNQYKSLEDLAMMYNTSLEGDLERLKTSYDSSVFYLDSYLDLIKTYPIPPYQQTYNVKLIQVYHMDGLTTRVNFLNNAITLWNYGDWVDRVKALYRNEIVPLKEKLKANELRLTKSLEDIPNAEVVVFQKIDKDLIFNLNNYDKNSLALSLLHYKTFKQEHVARMKKIATDTTLENKLILYSILMKQNRVADSLLGVAKQSIKPLNYKKHVDFFANYYGGERGLEAFIQKENQSITSSFKLYRDTLKSNLVKYARPTVSDGKTIKLGLYMVPLSPQKKSLAEVDELSPVTLKRVVNTDGSIYLAGIHKMNKKIPNIMAFVARVNPDGKTGWIKEYNLPPDSLLTSFDNYVGDIAATQEGCGVIITSSVRGTNTIANTFVILNDKGEEKLYPIKEARISRKVLYQERSNTFTIVFKGIDENQNMFQEEPVSLVSINILGDLNWRKEINFTGNVKDLIAVRDGYLMVGNFTAMRDPSGKELKTKVNIGQANPYVIKIGHMGDILKMQPYPTERSIVIDNVVKVNDESINIIGREGSFADKSDGPFSADQAVHMMITYQMKQISSDL